MKLLNYFPNSYHMGLPVPFRGLYPRFLIKNLKSENMKLIEKKDYKILKDDNQDVMGFADKLTKSHSEFEHSNLVIDLLDHKELTVKELLMFLEIANIHARHRRSFVIVNNSFSIDEIPEELVVVPTLQEAEDIVRMDEMERDL